MNFRSLFSGKRLLLVISVVVIGTAVFLVLLLSGRPPKKPDDLASGDYSYAIDYSEHQINASMKKYKIPGVIFAMIDGDSVVFSNTYGYADIENKIETTADTIFKAGSISKVFTGIEVMRLQEDGLIDINDPLTDYLPEFKINNRFIDSPPVTISSLLSHRSGLPRGSTVLLWAWDYRPDVLDAQVKGLSESYMVYPADYRYKYSNIGYNVLARMIETVKGLEPPSEITAGAFPYYMQESLFSPLGMNETGFGSSELMYGTPPDYPSAMGYYRDKGKNVPYNQFDIISMASGNVHTTLNDMIKFTTELLTSGEDSLLSRNMLDLMYFHRNDTSRDLKDNGLTWFRNSDILGETVVFHDGTNQGFISMLAMIPEHDIAVIIMANSDEFENVKSILSFDVLRVMLEAKTGRDIPVIPEKQGITVDDDILMNYEGKYLMNDEIISVFFKNSRLKARYKGFSLPLIPLDENCFTFNNPLGDSVESRFTFHQGNDFENPYLILEMGDAFFCPRYPVVDVIPVLWKELEGKYTKYARHPSEYGDSDIIGNSEITIKDGILFMSGSFALLPIEDNMILIQGGVFHGETMEYDSKTGEITWQAYVYRPESED